MRKLKIPILVEGKYDKAKLCRIVDAPILTSDGFRIFNNEEKRTLLRRLGENGLILLCDSDGGGRLIRSHLRGMLSGIPLYDLYTPQIPGKESRKRAPSAAGFLGVEGIPDEVLRELFERFAAAHPELVESPDAPEFSPARTPLTRCRFRELGLTGAPNASGNRAALCRKLGFPPDMTANALFAALNLLMGEEELEALTADR